MTANRTPMTAAELAALAALERKATPGDWRRRWVGNTEFIVGADGREIIVDVGDLHDRYPNADFIVAARNAMPRLLAEVEAQRAEIERLRGALSDARSFVATTLARIGDGHRIAELCCDWDYLLNPAISEPRHD